MDENGNPVAADYVHAYTYGKSFYVLSPSVSGYTPTYDFIASDKNGMPGKDVEVTVSYVKNKTVVDNAKDTGKTPDIGKKTENDGNGDNGSNGNGSNGSGTNGNGAGSSATNVSGSSSVSGMSANNSGGSTITGSYDDDDDDDEVVRHDDGHKDSDRNKTDKGVTSDGKTTSVTTGTPEVTNDEVRDTLIGGGSAGPSGSTATKGNAAGSDEGTSTGRKTSGGVIKIDGNGKPHLVSADDTETPLMNLGLGDHACNILRLLILLVAFGFVIAHTKSMRRHQSRIFELREKLDDARKE